MEVEISQNSAVARFAFPDQCSFISIGPIQMAIHTVVAKVCCSSSKPFEERFFRIVQNLVPGFKPMQLACCFCPKCIWIINTLLIELLVSFHSGDMRLILEILGWREFTIFVKNDVELLVVHECRIN